MTRRAHQRRRGVDPFGPPTAGRAGEALVGGLGLRVGVEWGLPLPTGRRASRPARWRARVVRELPRPGRLLTGLFLLGLLTGCEAAGPAGGAGLGPRGDEDVWAIRCMTLPGGGRQREAEQYAEALRKVPGIKPELVQVFTDEDGTSVFYGRYERFVAVNGQIRYRPDPTPDLDLVRRQKLNVPGVDVWPFILATLDVPPTFRPSHPEWDLRGVDGFWGLQVAVFYNTETFRTRRAAAEEYCRLLRSQGESAYFHHGAAASSVVIGPFPETAVITVRSENPLSNRVTVTERIVDPAMLEAQRRFPHNLHNGHIMYEVRRDARGAVTQREPAPSFPVVLPKAQRLLDEFGESGGGRRPGRDR